MATIQYQRPPQAPPVFNATADSLLADMQKTRDRRRALLDKLVAEIPPSEATFANVMHPILVDENERECTASVLLSLESISTSKEVRDAATKAQGLQEEFDIEMRMRDDVFALVEAAYQTRAFQNLDSECARSLEKERSKYVQQGLKLPAGPQRNRFKEVQKRISQLSIKAQKNLNEEDGGCWVAKEELEGVPADDIDPESLEKGTGANEGKVKVTFKYNHYFPILKYARSEAMRREYQIADANKSNVNVDLFKEIIVLRDEAARILGYPNHASLRIENKMAKTPAKVMDLLNDLRERTAEGGRKELEALREYKRRDCEERGVPFDGSFYMWDTSLYTRLRTEKEFSIDGNEISQYFPVDSTFDGMLKIFEEVMGFVFVEIKGEDRAKLSPTGKAEDIVWHEDVRVFSAWDDEASGGEFCGYIYTDLHPRDGKFTHNANFQFRPGFVAEDGTSQAPVTALICNFSKPSSRGGNGKPALLKHHEVFTMFHELGHGIHDHASRTRYSYLHGAKVVDDFVEAPSQMLENWCWTPGVLKRLSRHWETGDAIPDRLVESLVKTRRFGSALATIQQLQVGLFDMAAHSPESHEDIKGLDFGVMWNQLRHDLHPAKGPEDIGRGMNWGNAHARIGHFLRGYDAGYYGYLWSEVFSVDMFRTCFLKNPMDWEQGRRYRKIVLERGGTVDEMDSLTEFLGRPPSAEHFYKELGLA